MSTKVTFEASQFRDIIGRAAAIAPTRGNQFELLAGIVLSIDADNKTCRVQATDNQIFYMEICSVESVEGPSVQWRIPSLTFGSTVAKVPIGNGKTVTLDDSTSRLDMRFGKARAGFNLLRMSEYPIWDYFPVENAHVITDLGQRLRQVSWAQGDSKTPQLFGIAFGPNWMGATNKYRISQVEVDTGLDEIVLIPGKLLGSVIPERGDVAIAKMGGTFVVIPNEQTQIKTVTATGFPNLKPFTEKTFEYTARFSKSEFIPMIQRLLDFTGGDRLSKMGIYIGAGEIAIHIENGEIGFYGDIIDAAGDVENHDRILIQFNPVNLRDAIQNFPGEVVVMKYNGADSKVKQVCLANDTGYHSIIAPLADPPKNEEN